MKKRKIKRSSYILINTLLIFFFTGILFSIYTKKASNKINKISLEYFQKEVANSLNGVLSNVIINDKNEILKIYKNSKGEILYVDYDMALSYQLLNQISKQIKDSIEENEYPNKGIILTLPFNVSSDNIFINNLGPKITIKINYINSILTNIYTKITNYGLNNALVESYIKISIDGQIITPITDKKVNTTYDLLIAAKIINGRVPNIYGNYLNSNSSIFDVPID